MYQAKGLTSHPSRVRGLKLKILLPDSLQRSVAPLAGAWIETSNVINISSSYLPSHPSRVRGLKHVLGYEFNAYALVAPLAGAWIETDKWRQDSTKTYVAPLAGAWIETLGFVPALFNC